MRRELDREQVATLLQDMGSVPTLVVTGLHDRTIPPHHAQHTASALPGARFVVLPDCGHLAHEEQPRELVGFLVPFCQEVLGDSDDERSRGGEGP